MTELAQKIHDLHKSNPEFSAAKIGKILNCCPNNVRYYLVPGYKSKKIALNRSRYHKNHPFKNKLTTFIGHKAGPGYKVGNIGRYQEIISDKIRNYHRIRNKGEIVTFSYKDVIKKFGEKPKCYLTGDEIDIYQPRTYHFDHIIPLARGGESTLDNLGICTKEANLAKSDKTPEEFIALCRKVIQHNTTNP